MRSHTRLAAENLFLRKQLACYVERRIKPRRLDDDTRLTLGPRPIHICEAFARLSNRRRSCEGTARAFACSGRLDMTPCADLRTPDNDAGLSVNLIVHSLGQRPQCNRGGCDDTEALHFWGHRLDLVRQQMQTIRDV
jgi:hypothetical protein